MAAIDHARNYYCIGDECECEHCERRAKSHAIINGVLAERERHNAELADTAFHEAAHACMTWYLGHSVKSLAIDVSGGECLVSGRRHATAKDFILMSLAPVAADAILHGRDHYELYAPGFGGDMKEVKRLFRGCRETPTIGMLHDLCDEARAILERPRVLKSVKELADKLLERRYIQVRRFKPPRGTLARRIQGQRAEQRRSAKAFRSLMRNADAFWASSGAL